VQVSKKLADSRYCASVGGIEGDYLSVLSMALDLMRYLDRIRRGGGGVAEEVGRRLAHLYEWRRFHC
jgi:hypothetical protein